MKSRINWMAGASLAALLVTSTMGVTPAGAMNSSTLPQITFNTQTGMTATPDDIQSAWSALKTMGTTQFLGGMIGGFKLDESSMIAAALTIGAGEFDNYLRTGKLDSSIGNVGGILSSVMTKSAGIDLSSMTGSFTSGGGVLTPTALLSGLGASSGGGQCDPSVANDLTQQGIQKVNDVVNVGMSKEYGFSQMSSLTGSGATGSFASMGCLDKLFQNTGTDIMFKPPTMGILTNMLQNWTCPKVPGVAEQVAGAFGSGDRFQTASLGGFFPLETYGEANEGASTSPGILGGMTDVFGASFGKSKSLSDDKIGKMTNLSTLFK